MANQTRQLALLLKQSGLKVELAQVNAPYRPSWVGRLKGVRALFRLIPYLLRLHSVCGRVDLVHVMANSGWSWHLFAAPAVWIAHWRGAKVVLNYRGGEAGAFFQRSYRWVRPTLKRVDKVLVPSGFLEAVFSERSVNTDIVPNIINLQRFPARPVSAFRQDAPHIIVTRNLEPIYDIPTALRCFLLIQKKYPQARMTVAGSGPEKERLEKLRDDLGLASSVIFSGRIDNEKLPALYQQADLMLNPSTADNMPISVLEALASGVPVVSTAVGGVPFLVEDGVNALLAPVGDAEALAVAALSLLGDEKRYEEIRVAGLHMVKKFSWPQVQKALFQSYRGALQK
jgi:glycosyltransferase involved in cell wall biosynthesis